MVITLIALVSALFRLHWSLLPSLSSLTAALPWSLPSSLISKLADTCAALVFALISQLADSCAALESLLDFKPQQVAAYITSNPHLLFKVSKRGTLHHSDSSIASKTMLLWANLWRTG